MLMTDQKRGALALRHSEQNGHLYRQAPAPTTRGEYKNALFLHLAGKVSKISIDAVDLQRRFERWRKKQADQKELLQQSEQRAEEAEKKRLSRRN